MTTQKWLRIAAIITGLLALFVAVVAWRSLSNPGPSADEIRARADAQMNRIEERVRELEQDARKAE